MGADAYSERMDCFRSGREGPEGPTALEVELDGLPGGAADPPKKSRPRSESAALFCLGGDTPFGGGGRALEVSVVLGRMGGSGTSPNRST